MKFPISPSFVLLVFGLSYCLLTDAARPGRHQDFQSRPNHGGLALQHGDRSSTGVRRNFNPRNNNGKVAKPRKFVRYQGNDNDDCRTKDFNAQIRHVKTKEYLYPASNSLAVDDLRRRVFTWRDLNDVPNRPPNTWTKAGQDLWRIEFVDQTTKKIRIKSLFSEGPDEYLFTEKGAEKGRCNIFTRRGSQQAGSDQQTSIWELNKCFKSNGNSIAILHNPSCQGDLIGDGEKFFFAYNNNNRREMFTEESGLWPEYDKVEWEIIPVD